MKARWIIAAAALLVALALAGAAAGIDRPARVAVVVELEGAPALERGSARSAGDLRASHRSVVAAARGAGVDVEQTAGYAYTFNGFAAEVEAGAVDALERVDGVAAVHEDATFRASLADSVPLIRAPEVWERRDPLGRRVRGNGVTVAVIDTGVDYAHEALGGALGEGHKVVAGHDFVNDDADPVDDNGHGTHVAGIVAASGTPEGVAPEAELTAYKVLNSRGFGTLSDILAGIEAAASPANPHRADVINMSLGGAGDGSDPLGRAASVAVDAGIVVVAAAGNAGPGYGTVESPAAAPKVVAVGASLSGVRVPSFELVEPQRRDLHAARLGFSANPPDGAPTVPVVDAGAGSEADFERVDVRGKAALVSHGPSDIDAALRAERHGAVAAIFYPLPRSLPGKLAHEFATGSADDGRLESLVAVQVDGDVGALLRETAGARVRITGRDATDEIAAFSARGPSLGRAAKPDLVAPGVEVRSTVPTYYPPGYYRFSGTSMASPHVAGAAALLRQLDPEAPVDEIGAALVGSAVPLDGADPLTQGAGRLDVARAASAQVAAHPRALTFGLADLDDEHVLERRTIALDNVSDEALTLRLSVREADEAAVRVSPKRIELGAGERRDVTVTAALEDGGEEADVSGWIKATPESAQAPSLRIPYELAVRHLQVHSSPDPTRDDSEAFVYSPVPLSADPVVEITRPDGSREEVTARLDHGTWWRVALDGEAPGVYELGARGTAESGERLVGAGSFEVVEAPAPGAEWRSIGPNSMGGAMSFGDPGTMRVLAPGNPSLFASGDGARTWRQLRSFPVAGGIPGDMVTDPRDRDHLYVSMSGQADDPSYVGKLFESRDGGDSWTSLAFPNVQVLDLAIDGAGSLAALTASAIRISADGGGTWTDLPSPNATGMAWNGGDLFFAAPAGLHVIRDAATEPQPAELVLPTPSGARIGQIAADERIVTAVRGSTIVASTDGGTTWEQLHDAGSSIRALRLAGDEVAATTSSAVWVSRDLGKAWERWPDPNPAGAEYDFGGWPGTATRFVSTTPAGIYATGDGGASYQRAGVPAVGVNGLAFSRSTDGTRDLVAATDWSTYVNRDPLRPEVDASMLEWGPAKEAYVGERVLQVAADPSLPQTVYRVRKDAVSDFWVQRSRDGGATWTTLARETEVPTSLLIHPADPTRIYVGYWSLLGTGVFFSHDGGETWAKRTMDTLPLALAGDPENRNVVWAGGADGLWRSTDGAQTFRRLQDDVHVTALEVDPRGDLLVGGRRLFTARYGGTQLRPAEYANVRMLVTDFVVDPNDRRVAYAAAGRFREAGLAKGGRGVLRTTDRGRTWTNISAGLDNADVTSLAIAPDGSHLFAGTSGGGVHRVRLPGH